MSGINAKSLNRYNKDKASFESNTIENATSQLDLIRRSLNDFN